MDVFWYIGVLATIFCACFCLYTLAQLALDGERRRRDAVSSGQVTRDQAYREFMERSYGR